MPPSSEHPSGWTLELFAEEALPGDENALVGKHVSQCGQCYAEVESLQFLFGAFAALPEHSPSEDFADRVMSRVRIAPQHSPIYAWILRVLPATRRGWALLLGLAIAPALPIFALAAWLLTNPMVSPSGLWNVATEWLGDAAWSAFVTVTGGVVESNAVVNAHAIVTRILETPTEILLGAGLLLGVGIPLSAWILYRTLRTPDRGSMYAH